MDFKDCWRNGCFGEYHDIYAKNLAEQFYKAGQGSKQEEVNKLQAQLDKLQEEISTMHKRINEALELINNQHDTSTIKFVRYAINKILKGE